MLSALISITDLQRQLKRVFASKQPYHLVLSNNAMTGMVFSKKATQMMMESGVVDQILEELEELNDKETVELVRGSRKGKGPYSISYHDWKKKQKNL